jgi:DNA-directed RNA polymerase subunit RPC12/RpoP
MEKCAICGKKRPSNDIIHIDYTPHIICSDCFSKMIEKRVKRNIRFFGPLEKGVKGFLEGKEHNKKIATFMLKKFFHPSFFELADLKKNADLLINSKSLEEICMDFLDIVFHNKQLPTSRVFLFCDIPQEELHLYAKINNIKLKKPRTPDLPALLKPKQNRFSFASSFKTLVKLKQDKNHKN